MLTSILIILFLAVIIGLVLGFSSVQFKVEGDPIIEKIDSILPQTQCGQCSYPGCKPYATAIAKGDADINQCPPGGEKGVRALAELMGVEYKPLNESHGINKPKAIIANTIKGNGIKMMENNHEWHHKVPSFDELKIMIEELS